MNECSKEDVVVVLTVVVAVVILLLLLKDGAQIQKNACWTLNLCYVLALRKVNNFCGEGLRNILVVTHKKYFFFNS